MSTELLHDSVTPSQPRARSKSAGRRWTRLLFVLGLLAVIGIAATLYMLSQTSDTSAARMTYTLSLGPLTVSVIEQGTLESSNNAEIKCTVRGFSTVNFVVPGGTLVEEGDVLVRLDTKMVEEAYSLTKTNTFIATATLEQTKANVAKAEIAIDGYLEGRYRQQVTALENRLETAKSNLLTANKMLDQTKLLFKRGYVNKLEVEGNTFTVTQAKLELEVIETELDVLQRFTREMELETLNGNMTAAKSKLQADEAGLKMEMSRRDRAAQELKDCVIRADRSGLVIYPSAAAWKDTPDIAEGVSVRKDQVLLLMPDLNQMQVKVAIHESYIDRTHPGLKAIVTLPDRTLEAKVSSVATVTKPSGWWTGNLVTYDTVIEMPEDEGLKPGMSAEVEIILAEHTDVLTIPVAAVVESDEGDFCWIDHPEEPQRRSIKLGESNNVFMIVESGLLEGDKVVLNPAAFIAEAESTPLKSIDDVDEDAPAENQSPSDSAE